MRKYFSDDTYFEKESTKASKAPAIEIKTEKPLPILYLEREEGDEKQRTSELTEFNSLLAKLKDRKAARPIHLVILLYVRDDAAMVCANLIKIFENRGLPSYSTLVLSEVNLDDFIDILPVLKNASENFTLRLDKCKPTEKFMKSLAIHIANVPPKFSLKITRFEEGGHWHSEIIKTLASAIINLKSPLFSFEFSENGNNSYLKTDDSEDPDYEQKVTHQEFTQISKYRLELMEEVIKNNHIFQFTPLLDFLEIPLLERLIKNSRDNLQLHVELKQEILPSFTGVCKFDNHSSIYNLLAGNSSLFTLNINSLDIDLDALVISLLTNKTLKNLFLHSLYIDRGLNRYTTFKKIVKRAKALGYINSDLNIQINFCATELFSQKQSISTQDKAWKPFRYPLKRRQLLEVLSNSLPFPKTIIDICADFNLGAKPLPVLPDLSTYLALPWYSPSMRKDPFTAAALAWKNPKLLETTHPETKTTLFKEIKECVLRTLKIQPIHSSELIPDILCKVLNIGFWMAAQQAGDYIVHVHPEKIDAIIDVLTKINIMLTGIIFSLRPGSQLLFQNVNIINLVFLYCLKSKMLHQELSSLNISAPPLIGSVVDTPDDGNCLFWSASLAWLLEDKSQFSERYDALFGTGAGVYKAHIKSLLQQSSSSITADPIMKKLVCQVFRGRVFDYAEIHFKDKHTVIADTGHLNWKSYADMARKSNSFAGRTELLLISSFIRRNFTVLRNTFFHQFGSNDPTQKTLKLFHVNPHDKTGTPNHYRFLLENKVAPSSPVPTKVMGSSLPVTPNSNKRVTKESLRI